MDEEKQDPAGDTLREKDEAEEMRQPFQPVRNITRTGSHQSRPPARIQQSRSIPHPDGYLAFDHVRPSSPPPAPQAMVDERPFEVHWDGEKDPANPRSMGSLRKRIIVLIVSLSSACVTCTSSMYTSTYGQITKEFRCSQIVATLGLSLFVMGLGLGPMILSPLSEFYGRKPIYVVSFSFFLVWLIPCALAQNIETMLVARFLDGLAGSAFLSVAGGTIGDLFDRSQLQAPMMIYSASPFIGPPVGPIVAGFINYYTSWRWTFYVLLIWSAAMLAGIIVIIPETYEPVLLRRKAILLRKETGNQRWQAPIERLDRSITRTVATSIYRPFLLLTREPMCLNLCLFSALLLGVLYLFFGAFPIVFEATHQFNLWQVGLTFSGLFVGIAIAVGSDPLWHRNYERLVWDQELNRGERRKTEPEYRLPPAIAGAILVPVGLLWFGWTTFSSVHWIVPIAGSTLFGTGMLLVFSGVFTFLVDAYPLYAASALAANSFARSSFAAAFPLFGVQMYHRLGFQWATTALAGLTVVMAPFPYVFFRYGRRIRGDSKFAGGR
ncbi:MAG: hypothetical protein LQ349_005415 [Xanthoria aureola]|nr:MAG: hypothetical protein LQ349_005415 [Xanthoria aureola]